MAKLSDFRATPGGGGGGGGGSGIKGTWNVTPTYTPPEYVLPDFTEPVLPQVNFDGFTVVGPVVTISTNFGTNPSPSPAVKVASAIVDLPLTPHSDTVKSYRIQLGFPALPDSTNPVTSFAFFGYIEASAAATNSSINTLVESLLLNTYSGSDKFLISVVKQTGGDIYSEYYSQGLSSYSGPDLGLSTSVPQAITNTCDMYPSWFDGASVGQPGNTFLSLISIPNSTVGGSEQGNFVFIPVTGLTTTYLPVFGVISIDTVGSNAFVDLDVSADFQAAYNRVEVSHLSGLGAPQNILDSATGYPIPAIGSIVPESYTQVTAFPVGAAVNDLYIASVSNGYAGSLAQVKPMNKWVRDGEIIRVTSLSPTAFDVFNEWRDSGGQVTVVDVNLSSTPTAVGGTVSKSTDAFGNETISSPPGEYSSSFLSWIDPLIYSKDNADILNSEGPSGPSRFRWEFGHVPFADTSKFRQSVQVTLTSGSKEAIIESNTDGYHGIYTAGDGELVTSYPNFFIMESSGGVEDLETMICGAAVSVTTSLVSGTFAVGDVIYSLNNSIIAELDGFGLPSKIVLNKPTSFSDIINLSGSNLTTTSGEFNLTLVGTQSLLLNRPAIATGTYTLYYDYYPQPFRKVVQSVHFGDNLVTGYTTYTSAADAGEVLSPSDIIKGGVYVRHDYNSLNDSFAGQFIRQDIPGDKSGLGYSLVFFLPRMGITSRIDPYSLIAHELDFTNKTITIRFKTTDAVEHSIEISESSILADAQVDTSIIFGSTNDEIGGFGEFYGDGTTTVWNTFQTVGTVAPLVRLWKKTVSGEVVLLSDSDFTVTNVGEITFSMAPATGEKISGQYAKGDSAVVAFVGGDVPSPSVQQVAELFIGLIDSYIESTKFTFSFISCQGHADVRFNYGYGGTWERPNPNAYIPYIQKKVERTPTLGNLFIVDEQFDPLLGQEMEYQVNGALAVVKNTGRFNGKQFIKGNYARWDGGRTVPFPDTAKVSAYEPYSVNEIDVPSGLSEYVFVIDGNVLNRINILNLPSPIPAVYIAGNSTSLGTASGNWITIVVNGSFGSVPVTMNGFYDETGSYMYSITMNRGVPYKFTQISNSFYRG